MIQEQHYLIFEGRQKNILTLFECVKNIYMYYIFLLISLCGLHRIGKHSLDFIYHLNTQCRRYLKVKSLPQNKNYDNLQSNYMKLKCSFKSSHILFSTIKLKKHIYFYNSLNN